MKMFTAGAFALFFVGCWTGLAQTGAVVGENVGAEGPPTSSYQGSSDGSKEASNSAAMTNPSPSSAETMTSPAASSQGTSQNQTGYEGMQVPVPNQVAGKKLSWTAITTSKPVIAITFDDGPSAQLTPKLLDMLKARGIHATFFVVGTNAAEYPDILKRAVAEGHEIGNHSWSHPALPKLSSNGVKEQMDQTNAAIAKAIGHSATVMRPPYGATNTALDRRLNDEFGMKVILWSVDPQDWRYRNSERVANYIIDHTKAGDIILAHDIHATTVAAMPKVLDALLAKGFQFVTVSQLLAMDEPAKATPRPEPAASSSPTGSKKNGKKVSRVQ